MNSNLESAIQEAMMELDRPTENVEPPVQANRYVKGRVVKKRRTRWRWLHAAETALTSLRGSPSKTFTDVNIKRV